MQFPNLLVKVYLIPGGEMVSRLAHESFSRLMEEHEEFKMASYHGMNRYDQQWHLVLIGPPHAFAQFRQEQERILQQAHAQEISVPEQSLLPLVAHYWKREARMVATGQSFVKYHYRAAALRSKPQKKKKRR